MAPGMSLPGEVTFNPSNSTAKTISMVEVRKLRLNTSPRPHAYLVAKLGCKWR